MTTQLTTTKVSPFVSYKRLNSCNQYVIARYLLALIKSNYKPTQWVYHNGSEGLLIALLNDMVADDYQDAVEELASRENESLEDIIADYKNWYYVFTIEDAIKSLESDINYYSPIS